MNYMGYSLQKQITHGFIEAIEWLLLYPLAPSHIYLLHLLEYGETHIGGFLNESKYALTNTIAFTMYGLSKFVSSHLVTSNLFRVYTSIFLLVGVLCISLGSVFTWGSSLTFSMIWIVNYTFMGMLWPVICKVFKRWLPDELNGRYWSVICCCSSVGTVLCNSLSSLFEKNPSWVFYGTGIIVVISYGITLCLFPSYEERAPNYEPVKKKTESYDSERMQWNEWLSILLLLLSVFISTLNQRVLCDWGLLLFPQILTEDSVKLKSASSISYIEIGGILGTLCCGWISDTFHMSRPFICGVASCIAGGIMWWLPSTTTISSFLILVFLLGFFLYIPFSFSELIALESVDAKHTNFIISMNGLVSPLGSVFSGLPIHFIIKNYGWRCIPSLLLLSLALFSVLLVANHCLRRYSRDSKDL